MSVTEPTSVAAAVQAAHKAFLMNRLQAELSETIQREVQALYQRGKEVTVAEVIDRELLIVSVQRLVRESPLTHEFSNVIARHVLSAIRADANQGATLQQVVPKSEYDKLVSHYAKFEKLRMELIRMVLNSPIYSNLISDVLYHGIKDYALGENSVAAKMPGVGALMKVGAKRLNKAMPNLEAAAESTIKKFIAGNLKGTVELSERILNNALSEGNIRNIADHFWKTISEKDFGRIQNYVEDDQVESSVVLGRDLWAEVRQSEYLQNMIRKVIESVMDDLGERKLDDLATEMGYTESYVQSELEQILPGTLQRPAVMDYLEQRIDATLTDFYASDAFKACLDQ